MTCGKRGEDAASHKGRRSPLVDPNATGSGSQLFARCPRTTSLRVEKGEQRIRLTPRGAEGRDVVIAAKRAATGTDGLGGRMCGIEQTVSSSEREALAQTCNVGNSGNDDG